MKRALPRDVPRNPRVVSIEFPPGTLRSRFLAPWWASMAAAVVAILIVALSLQPGPRPPHSDFGPALDFVLPTDENGTLSLDRLAGRVIVIHFVVLVCCSHSALEIGYMKEVEPTVRNRGVVFLSIAMNSTDNYYTPEKFRRIMGFGWTLALDLNGSVQGLYKAVETSTFVIDRDGLIRYRDDTVTSPTTLSSWLRAVV